MNLTSKLIYHKSALKFLEKQPQSVQQRIVEALAGLKEIPPIGNIKPLQGKGQAFRLRVGAYRVIFEVDFNERIVYINAIGNRGDIYK
ncbi:type II toxin-antitoxin system RelE family toxin [Bacillus cereus]|uniref:type II toxin-antitoxin system RelE family toxin n=1 Tax=Bacillus cereus TaxID=1396 RepID=UPI000BFDFDA9|nr:type II toxin-antitoxin system RelE/ParE family toxin [Bacillus cereus]PGR83653.1 plasmid stabilization protein [Bacillus cereus]